MKSNKVVSNVKAFLSSHRQALIVSFFVVIGVVTILATKAATNSSAIEPELGTPTANIQPVNDNTASGGGAIRFATGNTSSGNCGQRVANYSYNRPFGNAVWNQPICGNPVHPRSADYVSRFINYSNGFNIPDPGQTFGITKGDIGVKLGFLDETASGFGRNVYYTASTTNPANTTKQIYSNDANSNLDGNLILGDIKRTIPDRRIPWNNTWITNRGGDNELLIIENRENADIPDGMAPKGTMYELSGLRRSDDAGLLCGLLYTLNYSNRLCTYTVRVVRDPGGNIVDIYNYEGSSNSRGGGISMFSTLTTPEEIDAGEIRHALGIGMFNTAFGPDCTPAQRGTAAEGNDCGTAWAPAGKFEWSTGTRCNPPNATLYCGLEQNMTVPEGMRFRLKSDSATNAAINNWLATKNYSAAKERVVRIFITAMQDYGFMPVDTGGVAQIQVAAGLNPEAKALWVKNGITEEDDKRMLYYGGLLNESNLEVIQPPTNNCVDGPPSKYWCDYLTSVYN